MLITKQTQAVEEQDLKTGETNEINEQEFVEPVYLDDLESSDETALSTIPEPEGDANQPAAVDNRSDGTTTRYRHAPDPDRKWRVYGSLGVSTVNFAARAAVALPMNRYLSVDPSIAYWSRRDGEYSGNGFGPEVAGIAQLPNPTMFIPYVGAGVGYEKWEQAIGNDPLESNDTGTAFYFFGLNIMMTKNFGINVARRVKKYADEAPLDKDSREPGDNPEVSTEVGFHAVF